MTHGKLTFLLKIKEEFREITRVFSINISYYRILQIYAKNFYKLHRKLFNNCLVNNEIIKFILE